jgi:hypothetical protein
MAKQKKLLPARKPRDRPQNGDSILLRSAESVGRVIGSLQRQLDSTRLRLAGMSDLAPARNPRTSRNGRPTSKPKATAAVKTSSRAPKATTPRPTARKRVRKPR